MNIWRNARVGSRKTDNSRVLHSLRISSSSLRADFNVLAQIERGAGNHVAAVDAATKAYRLARCDGEPYVYHWGLGAARKHLRELGAPEPEMPPFDESKYEPMPEVEINPNDEFHVE